MADSSAVRPSTILICHEGNPINEIGMSRWLASFSDLRAILVLRETRDQKWRRVKREVRRLGVVRFVDVVLMRAVYWLRHRRRDRAWVADELTRLRATYPETPSSTRIIEADTPNRPEVIAAFKEIAPDLVIARCKQLIRPEVFMIPRLGTYVFHPGICPEYRNAHGCFWALANGDRGNVGATLLRIDKGVDTGPVFGFYRYAFDERAESYIVISFRVVLENLDALRDKLLSIAAGTTAPIDTTGRNSAVWGQPWLSSYLKWRWNIWTGSRA